MPAQGREPPDTALVKACRKGDQQAWVELVDRYERLIFSVPISFGLPRTEAEEIYQRVLVKLLDHLPRIRKIESLAAWLVTTARNASRDHLRRSARLTELDDADAGRLTGDDEDPVAALDAIRREHTLGRAFARLDDPCRGLLAALYLEDPTPSYLEIAERLGRPVGSLGPTRARCLEKLRKLFVTLGGSEPDRD